MNTMISSIVADPATDDQIKTWLQGEIQTALQGGGLDWLEQPLQDAIDEREETEPLSDSQRESLIEARQQIKRADGQLSLRQWDDASDAMYEARKRLTWMFPGTPGSRAMELQRELDAVIDAIEAADLQPGSRDWIMWDGRDNYTTILTDQPYYSPWLYNALEAWHAGDDIAIEGDRLKIIVDDDDLYDDEYYQD